jgi:hypothetical protein
MSSIPIGTGHPTQVDEQPKPLVGLNLPGLLNVAAPLRKMVDQRPDLPRGIDPSVRTGIRKLSVDLFGKPDRLPELIDHRDCAPINRFLVAFGQ